MNMDRFKFRVWNKNTHSFTTGGAIKFGGLCFVDEEDFGIKLGEHQECYIIEQCTGMKDKYGNLIYEGDLIKTANYKTGCPEIYVVKWCDECGLYQLESTQSDQIIDAYRAEKGAICGNIHEQKDNK